MTARRRWCPYVMACAVVLCAVVLFGLLVVPIGLLAGFIGGMPNQITTPFVEQWPLLKVLWASNPEAATRILMQQPLMVIAHSEPASGIGVWKLFFYPVPVSVYLAISIIAAVTLYSGVRGMARRTVVSLLPGMTVMVFAITYIQVSSCCTGGPRWALDVWLFSLAYNPLSTLIDWQLLYSRTEGLLSVVQVVLALLGAVLFVVGAERARNGNADANRPRETPNPPGNSS